MNFVSVLLPELILILAASVLFLLGMSSKPAARRLAPVLALIALAVVFFMQIVRGSPDDGQIDTATNAVRCFPFAAYIKMLAAGVGMLFVLLSWPTGPDATVISALNYSTECAEYFGIMLLSIFGIF